MTRPRITALLLVALVAVACSACMPPVTGPAGAPLVAVVGDSITNAATKPIGAELGEYRRSVRGIDGIDLDAGYDELVAPALTLDPDVLVIELGVNSAREAWTSADLVDLERILKATDSVPCVVWVTVTATEPSYFDHLGDGTIATRIAGFTASLTKRLPANPNVKVADYGAIERANPELIGPDGLHPTAAGSRSLARFIDKSIADLCP